MNAMVMLMDTSPNVSERGASERSISQRSNGFSTSTPTSPPASAALRASYNRLSPSSCQIASANAQSETTNRRGGRREAGHRRTSRWAPP